MKRGRMISSRRWRWNSVSPSCFLSTSLAWPFHFSIIHSVRHWIKKSEWGRAYSPVRNTAREVESSVPAWWAFCDGGSTGDSRVHSPQVGLPWQDHRQVPCVQWSVARGEGRGKGKGRQQAQGWPLKEQVSHMMESGLRFESLGAVYQL